MSTIAVRHPARGKRIRPRCLDRTRIHYHRTLYARTRTRRILNSRRIPPPSSRTHISAHTRTVGSPSVFSFTMICVDGQVRDVSRERTHVDTTKSYLTPCRAGMGGKRLEPQFESKRDKITLSLPRAGYKPFWLRYKYQPKGQILIRRI